MATRWDYLPGLKDDVVERAKEDVAKTRKGANVDSSKLKGGAKEAVREAGQRAMSRNIGRAGAAQGAFDAGYSAGRALDEATGVGKKIVDKTGLGAMAERMASKRDRVELSEDAKDRVNAEEVGRILRNIDEETSARKSYAGKDDEGMNRGGKVKKMAAGGKTASRRADGIAQRGKTRGKVF